MAEGNPQDGEDLTVAAFVPYALDTAPSQRFRIEQWAPHLAALGIRVVALNWINILIWIHVQSGQ